MKRPVSDAIESQMAEHSAEATKLIEAYEKTIAQPRDRELFDLFIKARETNSAVRKQYLEFSRTHTAMENLNKFDAEMRPAFDAYLKAMNDLVVFNQQSGDTFGNAITATVTSGITWTVVGVLFAIVISGGIAFVIVRGTNAVLGDAVSALRTGAEQVVSAAGQVAGSAQTLSQGATEQAASLEETSASMEEMASMARRNADNTREAAGLMTQVDERVHESNEVLQAMVTSMGAIQESSNKVAKIIKTIDEIAFQTNILALNAAVEAARAGEAGMGFAVVADEVRSLAQRSAQAARDTAALIEESIGRSKEGGTKVTEVAASIGAITESVTRVKGIVNEVREASRQQTQGHRAGRAGRHADGEGHAVLGGNRRGERGRIRGAQRAGRVVHGRGARARLACRRRRTAAGCPGSEATWGEGCGTHQGHVDGGRLTCTGDLGGRRASAGRHRHIRAILGARARGVARARGCFRRPFEPGIWHIDGCADAHGQTTVHLCGDSVRGAHCRAFGARDPGFGSRPSGSGLCRIPDPGSRVQGHHRSILRDLPQRPPQVGRAGARER